MKSFHRSRRFFISTACLWLLAGPPAWAATTGLEFAGGCSRNGTALCTGNGGNATEAKVAEILGVAVGLVSQVDTGFSVTGIDAQSGTWSVSDSAIHYLAFKSANYFILGRVTAASGEWMNDTSAPGNWDITLVDCKASLCGTDRPYLHSDFQNNGGNVADLSNVRAFSVVPIPAAAWLFLSGLGFLAAVRRRV